MMNNLELVQKQLEAYNAFDLEKFCACYHQEIIAKKLPEAKILIQGMESFKSTYQKLFLTHPQQNCVLKSRILINDVVIDEEFISGRSNKPEGLHAVAIYGFRDGLIDRVWFS